jgi:hypothetical protein
MKETRDGELPGQDSLTVFYSGHYCFLEKGTNPLKHYKIAYQNDNHTHH